MIGGQKGKDSVRFLPHDHTMPSSLEVTTYDIPFRSIYVWDCPPVTWSTNHSASYPVDVSLVDFVDYSKGEIKTYSKLGKWNGPIGAWRLPSGVGARMGRTLGSSSSTAPARRTSRAP